MIGYVDQALYVLSWLAVLKLLQLSVWPALRPLFGRLAYPVAYTTSLLLLLLGSFYLGLAHLPTWLAITPFLVLLGVGAARRLYGRAEWEGVAKWDFVFLVFFLFVLELRFFNPYVSHYSEQFMDLAWVASIMRNPVVTPLDPYFAGGTLDIYYYLAHWLMAQLGLLAGVPARVVFNLVLPTVFGLSAVNCYLIGHLLLERHRWLPLSLLVLVNPTAIHQLALGRALVPALDKSRHAIAHMMTEYPLFSAILADPHALVMSMINQLLLIALLAFAWTRWPGLTSRQRWVLMGLSAFSLGAMPGLNSWDVMVYGPLVVVVGLLLWWRTRAGESAVATRQALLFPFLVPGAAVIAYLPYLLQVQAGSIHGILLVPTPTDPVEFLMTHGFFFAILAVAIAGQVRRQPVFLLVAVPFLVLGYHAAAIVAVFAVYILFRRLGRFEELLIVWGLLLILFVELFYFREIWDNEFFRVNTLHKFYYIAWVLLGAGISVLVGKWLGARRGGTLALTPVAGRVLAGLVVVALLAFPVVFQPDIGRDLLGIHFQGGSQTLDGLAYLDYEHPGDADAVRFLDAYPGRDCIVEAVGDDYSYGAPISSFTGIPTIVGKPSRELQWRTNDDGWWWTRIPDVGRIYEEPDRTVDLMRQYGCELLYVGDLERGKYAVDLPSSGLETLYNRNGVQIYRLAPAP